MAPEIQAVVRATQAWLQSSWHVQVPFAWLEACVEWLQQEAGHLSQQQINRQALDQWLLTDLRDLDYPVLPEGLAEAQKTELSGTFCVQVDSFLDISQPAYGQLQKWKGTDCANDEVSAVTQTTQRPWEARPTRMLLMQVTDGVQNLEAMEYQPIPALSSTLRPGAKLQLQGQMVCRLGMLLLGPSNIKVLGGEVEDIVERNNQGRVLCRTLGLPEEEEQQQQEEGEEVPQAPQQGNEEMGDLGLDDAELLAILEAQGGVERVQVESVQDSGYRTLSETSTQFSRSSSVRSHVFAASSRSEASISSYITSQSSRGGSVQGDGHNNEQEDSYPFYHLPSDHEMQQEIQDHSMAEEDFPDEDFDDLPLDELDSVIFQQNTNVAEQSDKNHGSTPQNNSRITGNPNSLDRATKAQTAQFEQHTVHSGSGSRFGSINSRSVTQKRDYQGCTKGATGQLATASSTSLFSPAALEPSHEEEFMTNDESIFLDEDMDCFLEEAETYGVKPGSTGGPNQLPVQQGPRKDKENATNKTESSGSTYTLTSESSSCATDRFSIKTELPCGSSHSTTRGPTSNIANYERPSAKKDPQSDSTVPTLTSPPFTYLCLLEELMSKPHPHTTEIRVKAFIVTLLGKLSSNNGVWSVCASISDGTGYLDVELSNEVLTGLLGFSVAEKAALKRDPARRGELDAGMKRCQEELVDMCCVMTIVVKPEGRKPVVAKADQVNEKVLQELEKRVRDRRK